MRLNFITFVFLVISDSAVIAALLFLYSRYHIIHSRMVYILAACIILMLALRAFLFFMTNWIYYRKGINKIKEVVSDFKKGKFAQSYQEVKVVNDLDEILRELVVAGRHLDSIMTAQKKEIDNFIELYNSIIFSISSYFIVLDDEDRVLFANDGFYKKFQFQSDEVYSKKIEDIFYFVNARLKGGITQVRQTGKTVVLEKTHLLTLNKISIIADIKISNIVMKDASQIIIIIDDVTKKLRNDYQISLMSQISESIQKDDEIDRVLFTILTGVTSGTGLGFNRAMLFLVEDGMLVGKMAVGPDSFEEAIQIWTAASTTSTDKSFVEIKSAEMKAGVNLLSRVLSARFPVKTENVFTRALNGRENVHVADSWNDERVGKDVRDLMDVREFIVTPLVVVNKGIGIIVADNKFNQVPISNDSIELLSIFAFQAAISIEGYNNIVKLKREMQKIKERQEAMIESEKLAAVGRIAAHIAHEIRNPLVTMGGYAKRIVQQAQKAPKGETIARAAEVIIKESDRLEKTLSNVMDFTKPSTFIMKFNSVNEVIEDTCSLLHNSFQEKKIGVRLSLLPALPLVKSDFNQLKQVMLNLLQNAIDETPPAGAIEIASAVEAKRIAVYVRNEGSMILEESLSQIFDPFFTTKVTGVGLGLAIVKKIIADHGGEISVRNLPERGVEFKILLPLPGQ